MKLSSHNMTINIYKIAKRILSHLVRNLLRFFTSLYLIVLMLENQACISFVNFLGDKVFCRFI